MIARLTAALAALALAACATPVTTKAAPVVSSAQAATPTATMKRPNLVVSDIDRSIALYEGLLGFVAQPVTESSADSFSYPVFKIARDAKIRGVVMNDTQDQRAFALTEVTGMALPEPHEAPYMSALVIGVQDLPGKIATVAEMGLWTSPPKTVDGTEFRFIEQAFEDHDGHLIVLYEVLSE